MFAGYVARVLGTRVGARGSAFAGLGHAMLAGGTIRVGGARDTTVVLDPTATLANSGTVGVSVAFDADQPVRRADLPPCGAAFGALLVVAAVDVGIRVASAGTGVAYVECEMRVAAEDDRS